MKVRVKMSTGMYAESPGAPTSHFAGMVGWTVPAKFGEYDIGVIWSEDADPKVPTHFMWHELIVLDDD